MCFGDLIKSMLLLLFVIVISRLLKRYLKAKRTKAPAYSLSNHSYERCDESKVFPKVGQEKLRSDFQRAIRGQSNALRIV